MNDGRNIQLRGFVGRQPWELLHRNITVQDKQLGAGAFGDVMAGVLRTKEGDRKVALKRVR